MKPDEFIEKMAAIKFCISNTDEEEYGKEYIEKLKVSYQFKKRQAKTVESVNNVDDPIVNLIQNYDSSSIEIGMISFNSRLNQDKSYYYFGKFEVDDLVMDKDKGLILLKEAGKNHILYRCAKDSSSFLEALFVASTFLADLPIGTDASQSDQVCDIAEKCSELAGGRDYVDFFKMLIGCYN